MLGCRLVDRACDEGTGGHLRGSKLAGPLDRLGRDQHPLLGALLLLAAVGSDAAALGKIVLRDDETGAWMDINCFF